MSMKPLIAGTFIGVLSFVIQSTAAEKHPEPIQFLESEGAEIVGTFDAPGGLKGYAARFRGEPLGLYLTPDGKHVIVGTLLDGSGNQVTLSEIQKLVDAAPANVDWAALEKSHWIAEGDKNADKVVYAFMDPNCPYCAMFWQQAQPYLKKGGVQLRHIMVGVLRPTSLPIAAKILAAKDPAAALAEHESAHAQRKQGLSPEGDVPEDAMQKVTTNSQLMHDNNIFATPAVVYKDQTGKVRMLQGVPSEETMQEIFSSK